MDEVTDPFGLEVHRPMILDDMQCGLHTLTAYVAREHDRELAEVVKAAVAGVSGIAVLVGGSSTGKTRRSLCKTRETKCPMRQDRRRRGATARLALIRVQRSGRNR